MKMKLSDLRRLIREAMIEEDFTRSISGYPFADERDVTSQNPVIALHPKAWSDKPHMNTVLGDVDDPFEGDSGIDPSRDEEEEDNEYGDPHVDPYVRDFRSRSIP